MTEQWCNGERIGIFGRQRNPQVVVLHGGPAAYGGSDRLAKELSDSFRTYSPWQRPSGDIALSVEVHVEDLRGFICSLGGESPPVLVGESWGFLVEGCFSKETLTGNLVGRR